MHVLSSILAFSTYFFVGLMMILCFMFVYTRITPHNEWQLIKNNNVAAALAFSGTFIGYVIPLSSAAVNSVSVLDYLIWGIIALVVQLFIYFAVRIYMPKLSDNIIGNNIAAGMFMGATSLAGGIFNAACMTW